MHDDAGTPAKATRTWAKAWAVAFPTAAAPEWWPLHVKFSTQFKNFHAGFTTPDASQLRAFLTVMLEWRVNKLVCTLPVAQPYVGNLLYSICNTLQCQSTHGPCSPEQ
jgi:hypothetical protein